MTRFPRRSATTPSLRQRVSEGEPYRGGRAAAGASCLGKERDEGPIITRRYVPCVRSATVSAVGAVAITSALLIFLLQCMVRSCRCFVAVRCRAARLPLPRQRQRAVLWHSVLATAPGARSLLTSAVALRRNMPAGLKDRCERPLRCAWCYLAGWPASWRGRRGQRPMHSFGVCRCGELRLPANPTSLHVHTNKIICYMRNIRPVISCLV